jgi:hypothetical protein
VVVALIDGMGINALRRFGAHAPFLKGSADQRRTIHTAFPSTTVTSLTSLGTGAAPGQHGIVGYEILARDLPRGPRVINQLSPWEAIVAPEVWQTVPSIFSRCDDAGLPAYTVSQRRFKSSALTRASLGGGVFIDAESSGERVSRTVSALKENKRALVYVYWNELDKAGHQYGMDSSEYTEALEDIDFSLKRLAAQMPQDTLLLITADHGMVDVPESQRVDYSQSPELLEGIEFTAGEPRMVHLYWDAAASEETRAATLGAWRDFVRSKAIVAEKDEVVAAGWFGPVDPRIDSRIGDVLVAGIEDVAYYDGRRAAPHAFQMVGQHGSITKAETQIPLFVIPSKAR